MAQGMSSPIDEIKRRVYLVGFPLGIVAALGIAYTGWHQETPHVVDALGQPFFALLLAALTIGLWRKHLSIRRAEYSLFAGIVVMQLASLVYSAVQISGTRAQLWDLIGSSIWGLIIYTLAFLIFGVRQGVRLSVAIYLLSAGVWVAYLTSSTFSTLTPAGRSLFFQLYVAGGIHILLLYCLGLVISRQSETSARHELDAYTDPLTQLGNRRYLADRVGQEIARSARLSGTFSVIIFDIDYFKMVNDRYGHNAGDQALAQIGQVLMAHARKMDFVGRWGGEEFLVVLPTSPSGEAAEVAERLRVVMSQQSFGEVGNLTGSFGVAEYWPGDDVEALIQRADQALYQAKALGRDRVELFERAYLTS